MMKTQDLKITDLCNICTEPYRYECKDCNTTFDDINEANDHFYNMKNFPPILDDLSRTNHDIFVIPHNNHTQTSFPNKITDELFGEPILSAAEHESLQESLEKDRYGKKKKNSKSAEMSNGKKMVQRDDEHCDECGTFHWLFVRIIYQKIKFKICTPCSQQRLDIPDVRKCECGSVVLRERPDE